MSVCSIAAMSFSDGIFVGADNGELTCVIREIRKTGPDIEDHGHPADYVGVTIKKKKTGHYQMTQSKS